MWGGDDGAINLFSLDETSGTFKVFRDLLLDMEPVAKSATIIPSNKSMKTSISSDPRAIGYLRIGLLDESVTAVILDGVEATKENVKSGSYPVARSLFMNTLGEPKGLTKAFIDFILSEEGAENVGRHGYIPMGK